LKTQPYPRGSIFPSARMTMTSVHTPLRSFSPSSCPRFGQVRHAMCHRLAAHMKLVVRWFFSFSCSKFVILLFLILLLLWHVSRVVIESTALSRMDWFAPWLVTLFLGVLPLAVWECVLLFFFCYRFLVNSFFFLLCNYCCCCCRGCCGLFLAPPSLISFSFSFAYLRRCCVSWTGISSAVLSSYTRWEVFFHIIHIPASLQSIKCFFFFLLLRFTSQVALSVITTHNVELKNTQLSHGNWHNLLLQFLSQTYNEDFLIKVRQSYEFHSLFW
jgi:hypothetical protein